MNAKRILLAFLLLGFLSLTYSELGAQSKDSPSMVGARVLFVDFGTPNNVTGLRTTNGVEVYYRREISSKFDISVPLMLGVAHFKDELDNQNFFALDATGIYKIGDQSRNLRPYVLGGIGAMVEDYENVTIQAPVGLGVSYKMGKNAFLNAQGALRMSIDEFRNNLHLGIGVLYKIGKSLPDADEDGIPDQLDDCPDKPGTELMRGCPDTDGDGVPDNFDKCPEEIGVAEVQGCPDADKDGIADNEDKCPDEPGLVELQGCPDTDGDGIIDSEDECPEEVGDAENNGCPNRDADKDGVLDEDDDCPNEAGSPASNGCPDRDGDGVADDVDRCPDEAGDYAGCPDRDGDGIVDVDDSCPEQPGLINNKGCPELNEEERELLNFAMRAVQFETGRATLKEESFDVLDQIKGIMDRYPGYRLTMTGYTDSVGDDETNLILSEERAKACYQYLVSKGVEPTRLTYQGFGEDSPIASNRTSQGRRLNRRVEFDLKLE